MVQVFDIWSTEVARRPSTFIDKLLEHYGNRQSNKSNDTTINQEPKHCDGESRAGKF